MFRTFVVLLALVMLSVLPRGSALLRRLPEILPPEFSSQTSPSSSVEGFALAAHPSAITPSASSAAAAAVSADSIKQARDGGPDAKKNTGVDFKGQEAQELAQALVQRHNLVPELVEPIAVDYRNGLASKPYINLYYEFLGKQDLRDKMTLMLEHRLPWDEAWKFGKELSELLDRSHEGGIQTRETRASMEGAIRALPTRREVNEYLYAHRGGAQQGVRANYGSVRDLPLTQDLWSGDRRSQFLDALSSRRESQPIKTREVKERSISNMEAAEAMLRSI